MKIDSIAPQKRCPRRIQWAALSIVLLGLACSGSDNNPMEPGAPALSSLALTVMGTVDAGQPIDIKIEAVGSDGSRPYTAFNGPVTLTTDRGTVTPTEVTLAAGVATTTIELTVADGAVALTATTGTVAGNATINLTALSILPGAPGDPVETAIPDIAFEPRSGDYDTNHPDIPGIPISFNTMGFVFELGTTVGEANAILTNLGATIAGGIPGVLGQAPGILMIHTNSTSHATMTQHLQQLQANALVKVATEDWQHAIEEQPKPNGGTPSDWQWDRTPRGGNWGLELTRMPVVWNLNPSIERNLFSAVRMGIIDNGMTAHPDYPPFIDITPAQVEDHGMHVAGIMGASYDNGLGVDGVNPFGEFVTVSEDTLTILWQISALNQIMRQAPETKVVNISLGIDWGAGTSNPGGNAAAQQRTSSKGALCEVALLILRSKGKAPLICVAAGNESNSGLGLVDALYSGGWTNAALEWLSPEILVIENVKRDAADPGGATRATSSNIGGHLSAPGTSILSTINGGYGVKSGTSMASPFVAGLIGYLYALEPGLTQDEIKGLLLDTAAAVGGGAADRVDAADAVLAIDLTRGSDDILRRFIDIDDGTVDGNQRVVLGNPSQDFLDEDFDGDLIPGDGRIDMADFRRWRDWLLQVEGHPDLKLDGSPQHPKRDINGNDVVEAISRENTYARADFNLDGILSRRAKSLMPGAMGDQELTDLEVLQALFDDPQVAAGDLPGLIESADIHVALGSFVGQQGVTSARIKVFDGISQAPITERTVGSGADDPVITVATGLSLYGVKVDGLDGTGAVVCTAETDFTLAPGEDIYYRPECTNVVVEAQLPQFIEPGTPSPLLVSAGVKSGSTINYKEGIQISITATGAMVIPATGLTDVSGNFNSEVTLSEGTEQTTVFVTATDPTTGESATTSASAMALLPPAAVVFRGDDAYASASCAAGPNPGGQEQSDLLVQSDVFSFNANFSFQCEGACPDNAGLKAQAKGASSLTLDTQIDPPTGYLREFKFEGNVAAFGQTPGDTDECGILGAAGDGQSGINFVFKVLDEPAILDIDVLYELKGESHAKFQVFEGDSSSKEDLIYQGNFEAGTMGGDTHQITESFEVIPGKFYYFEIEMQAADFYSQGGATSFDHSMDYNGQIRLRKMPASPRSLSHRIR